MDVETKAEILVLSERIALIQDRVDSGESDLEKLREEVDSLGRELHEERKSALDQRQDKEIEKLSRSTHKWEVTIGILVFIETVVGVLMYFGSIHG